jgi:hypothetical protein
MSGDLAALVMGTALAVGALAFVLYPLFFAGSVRSQPRESSDLRDDASPVVALREIEFDRATGKLSDRDYVELRKTYAEQALRELREEATSAEPTSDDAIEARVRAYRLTHRECVTCGLRPEVGAIYCSTCGSYLDLLCPDCRAAITEPSAAFCSTCGAVLSRVAPQRVPA